MSLNRLISSSWFYRILLAIWVVSAVLVMFVLTRFDLLVHGQLYNFGLQFDHAWADSYYFYVQLMYVSLGVPIALSVFFIALSFTKKTSKAPEPALKQKLKPQPQSHPIIHEEQKTISEGQKVKLKEVDATNSGVALSCSSCQKMFSRPLVMLNFDGGKSKMVNVCPYCNHVLGDAEKEQVPKSDFQIADSDKKLTH